MVEHIFSETCPDCNHTAEQHVTGACVACKQCGDWSDTCKHANAEGSGNEMCYCRREITAVSSARFDLG